MTSSTKHPEGAGSETAQQLAAKLCVEVGTHRPAHEGFAAMVELIEADRARIRAEVLGQLETLLLERIVHLQNGLPPSDPDYDFDAGQVNEARRWLADVRDARIRSEHPDRARVRADVLEEAAELCDDLAGNVNGSAHPQTARVPR